MSCEVARAVLSSLGSVALICTDRLRDCDEFPYLCVNGEKDKSGDHECNPERQRGHWPGIGAGPWVRLGAVELASIHTDLLLLH